MSEEVHSPPSSEEEGVPTHIPVRVEDLDAVRAALNSVYYHQQAYDAMEAYRELKSNTEASPLTQALGRTLGLIQGYLASYLQPEQPEEQPDGEV